jgi:hypothetical protein
MDRLLFFFFLFTDCVCVFNSKSSSYFLSPTFFLYCEQKTFDIITNRKMTKSKTHQQKKKGQIRSYNTIAEVMYYTGGNTK